MKVGILGYGDPVINILEALQDSDIKVIGVQQDFQRNDISQEKFVATLSKLDIPLTTNLKDYDTDLMFVINFNKIIDTNEYKEVKLVNLHMGILPTWRGNSANSWAVMNGEKFVGYTIHQISEELDGGDIYYIFKTPVDLSSSYSNARNEIFKDIKINLARVLASIISGTMHAQSQQGHPFIYCAKIWKSDGEIKNWDVPCELILRKQYLFGPPGSGLSFQHKENFYSIGSLTEVEGFRDSLGVAGSIVNIKKNTLWIKVKDTAAAVSGLTLKGQDIIAGEHFKIGNRLPNQA